MNQDDHVCARRHGCVPRRRERQEEKGEHEHEPDHAELRKRLQVERVGIQRTAAGLDET